MDETCERTNVDGNVGLAFGLVIAAGMSTCLGAAIAFCMPRDRHLFLAICLAIAAGVMLFVSFVEIYGKATHLISLCVFNSDGEPNEPLGFLYSTLCFFGGAFLVFLFSLMLHVVDSYQTRRSAGIKSVESDKLAANDEESPVAPEANTNSQTKAQDPERPPDGGNENNSDPEGVNVEEQRSTHHMNLEGELAATVYTAKDTKALLRMGTFTAFALALHNFPEGLATFVSVLEDPKVGASVAFAIAIHNIPEGICVAAPIFYATGSRLKGFFWAALSGMAELLGALLGYAILRRVFNSLAYGVLFGIVTGMMVYISLVELLPAAHKYDPEDKVTTYALISGMIIMAISLVLFEF